MNITRNNTLSRSWGCLLMGVIIGATLVTSEREAWADTAATTVQGEEGTSPETRKIVAATALGVTYTGIASWAYFAWYYRNQSGSFTLRDEGTFGADTYAGGADKVGHLYSNYILARGTSQLIQSGWSVDPLSATLVANAMTLTLFTGVELKDGYHEGFGFSIEDKIANVAGNGLALLMETVPELDRMFSLRFEYFPSDAYIDQIREEGSVNVGEDYSGQRFMVAYHLASTPGVLATPELSWLRFVDVVGGYYTRNYLPAPIDPALNPPQRALFLGISLNAQQVVEALFPEERGIGYGAANFATEVLSIPYTTLDFDAASDR